MWLLWLIWMYLIIYWDAHEHARLHWKALHCTILWAWSTKIIRIINRIINSKRVLLELLLTINLFIASRKQLRNQMMMLNVLQIQCSRNICSQKNRVVKGFIFILYNPYPTRVWYKEQKFAAGQLVTLMLQFCRRDSMWMRGDERLRVQWSGAVFQCYISSVPQMNSQTANGWSFCCLHTFISLILLTIMHLCCTM